MHGASPISIGGAPPAPRHVSPRPQMIAGVADRQEAASTDVREALRDFLRRTGSDINTEFDVVLCAGEALSNAVRYGLGKQIAWSATQMPHRVLFELEYRSDIFDTSARVHNSSKMMESERGILLMRSLMDHVQFRFQKGMVRVSMARDVH